MVIHVSGKLKAFGCQADEFGESVASYTHHAIKKGYKLTWTWNHYDPRNFEA